MSVHPLRRRDESRAHAFEVRWRENGRQRSRQFDRKGDAERWDAEVKRRRQLGPLAVQHLTSRGPTLAEWIDTRWSPEHGANLEASTLETYAHDWKVRVEPWLGHLPLQDVTVGRLREWQAQRLADGVTPDSIIKARTVLSSVLRHAAESEAIAGNPLSLVRPPKRAHRDEAQALTPAQVEAIRARLDARSALIVSLLAYAGLRPGELRALRWSDVRDRTILVQRAADPDARAKSTKGSRRARTVRLLPALRADLDDYRASTPASGRAAIITGLDAGWTRAQWNDWRNDHWRPACRAAGLADPPRPYDLRHSFASLLLAEGRTVHDVAKQLGHSAEMTLRVYGHVIDEYAGLDQHERPSAEHEIATARERTHADQPAKPPRRPERAELDALLRQALDDGPPHQTSAHHAERLRDHHRIAVTGEAVTRAMKRLRAEGHATQSITRSPHGHPVLAWSRPHSTPQFGDSSAATPDPQPATTGTP
ncbi:MAG TPA: site-specific integrase [Solirubrobacteraceae bacterium]